MSLNWNVDAVDESSMARAKLGPDIPPGISEVAR